MRGVFWRYLVPVVLLSGLIGVDLLPTSAMVSSSPAPAATHLMGYGVNALGIDDGALHRAQGIGFNWTTAWVHYTSQPNLTSLRNDIDNAAAHGFRVLVKVRYSSERACPPGGMENSFADFAGWLAAGLAGRNVAYEIFNEPNLSLEWGGSYPDPGYYVRLIRSAYPRIKSADANAIVVTAGLATTGGDSSGAMNDETFIRRMYDPNGDGNLGDGIKGYYDALGSHPYGFAYPPDYSPSLTPLCFRRAEFHHQLMEAYGDGAKPVWATEFGWIINPAQSGSACGPLPPDRAWQQVSPEVQGQYLRQAYEYACSNWPWMGAMFFFNLDFNLAPWYDPCNHMCLYSIYNRNGTTRPAYTYLQQMAKTCAIPPTLSVQPTSLSFLAEPAGPDPSSQRVTVHNLGTGNVDWTASDNRSWITLSATSGSASYASPSTLYIQVNRSGLSQGTHTGTVTVSASGAQQSPQSIAVTLYVGPLHHVYVPLVTRNASGP